MYVKVVNAHVEEPITDIVECDKVVIYPKYMTDKENVPLVAVELWRGNKKAVEEYEIPQIDTIYVMNNDGKTIDKWP